jgi:hypothetical protein
VPQLLHTLVVMMRVYRCCGAHNYGVYANRTMWVTVVSQWLVFALSWYGLSTLE